jgi:hypothetical protein
MTDYEYDNLPDEITADALPKEMFADAQAAFAQALESGLALNVEAKATHAYDRKGYLNTDSFIGHQNPAYRSETDDVIIQLTIRIPNPKTIRGESLSAVTALEDIATDYDQKAERARLEAELAQAEREAAQAEATAREKREKLEALRKK